jgi:hypothetical protein
MRLLALLTVGFFVGSVMAEDKKGEKVDNLQYKSWSKFKTGTAVTVKVTGEFGGTKSETVVTYKLLEVTDDKLVIEAAGVTTINGMEIKTPADKQDVPRQLDKPDWLDSKTGKPEGATEEGKEVIKIGGTEYPCRWYKYKRTLRTPDGKGEENEEGQVWVSDDVPGGMVKMSGKLKAGSMTQTTTEITIKK